MCFHWNLLQDIYQRDLTIILQYLEFRVFMSCVNAMFFKDIIQGSSERLLVQFKEVYNGQLHPILDTNEVIEGDYSTKAKRLPQSTRSQTSLTAR